LSRPAAGATLLEVSTPFSIHEKNNSRPADFDELSRVAGDLPVRQRGGEEAPAVALGDSVLRAGPLDPEAFPRHVAITPDGNRRWARAHGKSSLEGHEEGTRAFRRIVRRAGDLGVPCVSMWGMSLDNFVKRSAREVAGLLRIFRDEFRSLAESDDIHCNKVRVNVLGRWREKFPSPVRSSIEEAMEATKDYGNLVLNIFLAYSGTDEMLEAVRSIAAQARQATRLRITSALLKQHLFTKDLPPVDLLIRTGGEPHLSAGFMMWDVADAQLYFTEKRWPEFTTQDFDDALLQYARRERRLGS
jgi:undecaprenyl diphosphate synthase